MHVGTVRDWTVVAAWDFVAQNQLELRNREWSSWDWAEGVEKDALPVHAKDNLSEACCTGVNPLMLQGRSRVERTCLKKRCCLLTMLWTAMVRLTSWWILLPAVDTTIPWTRSTVAVQTTRRHRRRLVLVCWRNHWMDHWTSSCKNFPSLLLVLRGSPRIINTCNTRAIRKSSKY